MQTVEAVKCHGVAVANATSVASGAAAFRFNRLRINAVGTAAQVHVRFDGVAAQAPSTAADSPGQVIGVNNAFNAEIQLSAEGASADRVRMFHDNGAPITFILTFMLVKETGGP